MSSDCTRQTRSVAYEYFLGRIEQTMCEARGRGYDTVILDDCCAAPNDVGGKARSVILDNCKTFGGLILNNDEFVAATGKSQV